MRNAVHLRYVLHQRCAVHMLHAVHMRYAVYVLDAVHMRYVVRIRFSPHVEIARHALANCALGARPIPTTSILTLCILTLSFYYIHAYMQIYTARK